MLGVDSCFERRGLEGVPPGLAGGTQFQGALGAGGAAFDACNGRLFRALIGVVQPAWQLGLFEIEQCLGLHITGDGLDEALMVKEFVAVGREGIVEERSAQECQVPAVAGVGGQGFGQFGGDAFCVGDDDEPVVVGVEWCVAWLRVQPNDSP